MAGGFRGDIEGLRGLCVLAVVLFHAFPGYLPGGFVGVDVFFVISGYLITGILLRESERTGRIDLPAFWARRIRRILPAATFVLCCVAVAALFVPAIDGREFGKQVLSATLFYFNIRQARDQVDYLASDQSQNPLLHYWSLSVEEQFYIAWPFIVAGAAVWLGRGRSRLLVLIGGLWFASFAISCYLTRTAEPVAFFSTFSRSWQLLTGAFVAALGSAALAPLRAGGWLGLAVLAVSFFAISDAIPYPGLAAIGPTLAAAGLIGFGCRALEAPLLRYIGRISYSWYLWHWPMLVFAQITLGDTPWVKGTMIAASFAIAGASHRWIEEPARRSTRLVSWRGAYAAGVALIALGAIPGLALRHLGPDAVAIADGVFVSGEAIVRDRPVIYEDGCLLNFAATQQPKCEYGAPSGNRTVVLFGDSHAGNWFPALNAAAMDQGWRLVVRIKASCRPIEAPQTLTDGRDYSECASWRRAVIEEIGALRPDLIVVASTATSAPLEGEGLVLSRLADAGAIVVMKGTPAWPQRTADCLREKGPSLCEWPLDRLMKGPAYPSSTLPRGALLMDLNHRLCPGGLCRAVQGRNVVMFDKHHLTATFGLTLRDEFDRLLAERQQVALER